MRVWTPYPLTIADWCIDSLQAQRSTHLNATAFGSGAPIAFSNSASISPLTLSATASGTDSWGTLLDLVVFDLCV
jgi:hypothetical protein